MLHAATATPSGAPAFQDSQPMEVLDALPQPLLVALPDRRVLFANPSAERLLAEGLWQARADHLMAIGQLDAQRLAETLTMAAAGSSSRTGLWFTPHLSTGWLQVSPLAGSIARASGWPTHALLLVIHLDQPALTQAARIEAITRQCRLSPAERHVLLLLADGEPVEAASRHLGLCVSTVRSHVRSLLGKTQAPSLMQLLRWAGSARTLPH